MSGGAERRHSSLGFYVLRKPAAFFRMDHQTLRRESWRFAPTFSSYTFGGGTGFIFCQKKRYDVYTIV
ncbi:hypothetical protein Pse7429DRAFT_3380 [Pseudanabaena biceps PCC 7429]|uniref:Uncharacterized protein n=2 Tax=Pseudanabaena TaxID=1152 RepID=L8MX72_9CYAN|nr:hypothetical protein Pse7429DRAFT_3380 [Pseudanabaena biceps PCC 7429]